MPKMIYFANFILETKSNKNNRNWIPSLAYNCEKMDILLKLFQKSLSELPIDIGKKIAFLYKAEYYKDGD